MSSEQVDPQAVEETKQQIRHLVEEITRLTKQNLEPTVFYGEFLQRIVQALAAVGGAVWVLSDEGPLKLAYQINFRESLPSDGEDQVRHARLLQQVMQTGQELLVPPYSGTEGADEAGNPTAYLLVLSPLRTEDKTVGVVEVFQRPNTGPASQRGYQRFLGQMCGLAGDYFQGQRLRQLTDWQSLFSKADAFSKSVHESLDTRTTAYTIANEGRQLIGCDRVSVAIRRGRKCVIEAVSGQDTMDARANSVMTLGKLATAVVHNGETLWYTGPNDDLPPQIERAVHDYVDETHSKSVAVVPLMKPQEDITDPEELEKRRQKDPEPVGALIIEQIEDSRPPEVFTQRLDLVSEHSARALTNSMEYHGLFLMPVWRAIGKAKLMTQARNLPKTLLIGGTVLMAIILMFVMPWTFAMKGKGELQPVIRRNVFARQPGIVMEVLVEQYHDVKQGDPLAIMENQELDIQLEKTYGELSAAGEQLNAAVRRSSQANRPAGRGGMPSTPAELTQLFGEKARLQKEVSRLQAEYKLLEKKKEDLTVRSPIDGRVASTANFLKQLVGRTVQPGQVLMKVFDPNSVWELEIYMPEDKMGHIRAAERKANGKKLTATYVLANEPETKREGTVTYIHPLAELHEEHQQSVLMRIDIGNADLKDERVGISATAKVNCGYRPIGYVWFHQIWEFIQSRVFF